MNKVLIFLDSGQTIETYLNDNVVLEITEEIKKHIINKENNNAVVAVESDKETNLLVTINNIVAVKVIWGVDDVLGEY